MGKTMETYFKNKNGIGTNTEHVMRGIVYSYMEENPAAPFSYRTYNTIGFRRDSDGRCILDFDEKFLLWRCCRFIYGLF